MIQPGEIYLADIPPGSNADEIGVQKESFPW
jgi:hypothetical protein